VSDSTLRHTLVGRQSRLDRCQLDGAMLGDRVLVEGLRGSATLGDDSEVHSTPA
jgi:hypothetical protein